MNDLRVCNPEARGPFRECIAVSAFILALEIAGGILSNSLALLSDAGHVFADVMAIALSYSAIILATRPSSKGASWGYHRAEVFAAAINAAALIAVAIFIFYEAYRRFLDPSEVESGTMLAIAIVGLVGNIYVVLRLHGHHDLNVRSVYLHVMGDAISSVAVILGAIVIAFTGFEAVDALLSVLIGGMIIVGGVRLLSKSSDILLEKTPGEIDPEKVKASMKTVEGVKDVHDLHVWSVCSNILALSAHVDVDDMSLGETAMLIEQLQGKLLEEFDISHATFQFECAGCANEHAH